LPLGRYGTVAGQNKSFYVHNGLVVASQLTVDSTGNLYTPGIITSTIHIITSSTGVSSTNTGALQVAGGVGVAGGAFFGGVVTATNLFVGPWAVSTGTASAASSTGTTSTFFVNNTSSSTSTTTGALQVTGGVGIGGNLYVGGKVVAQELDIQYTTVTTQIIVTPDVFTITNTTNASSTITGALVVSGGAGLGGNLYVGGTVVGGGVRSISTSTAPANPTVGDHWYNTLTDDIYRYTTDGVSSYWLDVTGATVSTQSPFYGVAPNFVKYTRTTQQTGTISAGTVVICNVLENIAGSDISVNTSTGQITLAAGKTYRLRGAIPGATGSAGSIEYTWYNETASAYIGESGEMYSPTNSAAYLTTGGPAETVITTTVTTVVSFRVQSASSITALGGNTDFGTAGSYPWIDVEEISGQAAISAVNTPAMNVTNSTAATSTTTGALQVAGGVGIGGTLYVGTGIQIGTGAYTLSQQSYSGFSPTFSGTLSASQNGWLIQMTGNTVLPPSASVPIGGKFNFANHSGNSYTVTVNNVSTEFIYNANSLQTTSRFITMQPSETLELVSRGGTEWDVTGGSTAMRYQPSTPVLKQSVTNAAQGTTVAVNTIKAFANVGYLYIQSNTSTSIQVFGQAAQLCYGNGQVASTLSATVTTSAGNSLGVLSTPFMNHWGDIHIYHITDATYNFMYRVSAQLTGATSSSNYNVVIEQLG